MDEWFALSAKYYLDEKMADCSANVERMFTRLLAYCRLARTGGFVPQNAHVLVGLPRRRSDVLELARRGVLEPIRDTNATQTCTQTRRAHDANVFSDAAQMCSSGWRFPAWDDWQEMGDALDKRRKSDRLRKRKQRYGVTGQSRDTSAKSPQPQNRTEQELPKGSQPANGHIAREREAPRGPSVSIDAVKLVRSVLPKGHPPATQTALAHEVGAMLIAGNTTDEIRAGLELWLDKPTLGPRTLPSLVSEVIRSRDRPATNGHAIGAATTKAAGWLAIGEHDNAQKAIDR